MCKLRKTISKITNADSQIMYDTLKIIDVKVYRTFDLFYSDIEDLNDTIIRDFSVELDKCLSAGLRSKVLNKAFKKVTL